MADFFDDLTEDTDKSKTEHKPFFMVAEDDDSKLLTWFMEEIAFLREENQDRFKEIKNNYARYKGIQYREQMYQPRDLPEKRVRYMPQMVVPLISDAVDEKTARLLEIKPSVVVVPMDDEQSDKADAKVAKRFLTHVEVSEGLDMKFYEYVKSSKIAGESFMFVLWDPNKGTRIDENIPMSPEAQTDVEQNEQIQNENAGLPVYEGDVSVERETSLNCLYEKAKNWQNTNYIFRFEFPYTEELKRMYPDKADQIKVESVNNYYDFEKMEEKSLTGRSIKISFWHKKTMFLPEGFECTFTKDVILKRGDLPYQHGDLPCEWLPDVLNEQEQSGESFIKKIKSLASQYNNYKNMAIYQNMLASFAKWFVEGGSVDDQSLNNDVSIVKVKPGSKPPVLMQGNPVSPQFLEQTNAMKEEFYQMAKSNSLARGEPPPGVTAFVALQFVSETENKRISSEQAVVNDRIKKVYNKILVTAGQYYKKGQERTLLILGKDNRWNALNYDPASLQKKFSINLQNAPALPESKALRTQYLLDLAKGFPGLFPAEQVLEMTGLAQTDKFIDEGSAAARAAEAENEMILDGGEVLEPEEQENQIVHWRIHVAEIQDIGFKKMDEEVKSRMKDHIMAHEMLMMNQALRSSSFAQALTAVPQFPMFFTPDTELSLTLPAETKAAVKAGSTQSLRNVAFEDQVVTANKQADALAQMPAPPILPGDPAFSGGGPKPRTQGPPKIPR